MRIDCDCGTHVELTAPAGKCPTCFTVLTQPERPAPSQPARRKAQEAPGGSQRGRVIPSVCDVCRKPAKPLLRPYTRVPDGAPKAVGLCCWLETYDERYPTPHKEKDDVEVEAA